MTKSETFLALYCLVAMVAMFAAGLIIRLTIIVPGLGDYLAWAIYLFLFYLFFIYAFRSRSELSQSSPKPVSQDQHETPAEPGQAEGPAEPGQAEGGPEAWETDQPFRIKTSESPLLELFLVAPGFRLKVMLAILGLDVLGLVLPAISSLPMRNVIRFEAHISVWGTVVMAMCFSSAYIYEIGKSRSTVFVFFATLLHCLLTLLAHDLLAAKSLALVLAFCFFFCLKGGWSRFAGLLLMLLYFLLATVLERTWIYWYFSELDWTSPLFGAPLAYDSSLKFLSSQLAGFWGQGRAALVNLEFVLPELMYFNGFSYLKVMSGDIAVMIYSFLDLSTIMVLFWFIFKRLDMVLIFIVLPFWGLVFLDQSLTVIAYLNSGFYGLTHGPAFIGSYESGILILVLATAIMQPGRPASTVYPKKTNLSDNIQKPLRPLRPTPRPQRPKDRPEWKSWVQSPERL